MAAWPLVGFGEPCRDDCSLLDGVFVLPLFFGEPGPAGAGDDTFIAGVFTMLFKKVGSKNAKNVLTMVD